MTKKNLNHPQKQAVTSHSKIIGIDPGKSGGITVIDVREERTTSQKCPSSPKEMATVFSKAIENSPPRDVVVYLEKVWAFPSDAKKTAFIFGQNYGQWEGIISSHNIAIKYVTPKEWMKFYEIPKLSKKDRKNYIKDLAKEMCEDLKVTLSNSDSILIAFYGLGNQGLLESSVSQGS